jgi:hypothetical protein
MAKYLLAVGLAGFLALAALAADRTEAKKVEMTGTLKTGIVAIGGETTGTIIETKKGTYELDFGDNKELRKKAASLNGKKVSIEGTLTVRPGVEIKERRIIKVTVLIATEKE